MKKFFKYAFFSIIFLALGLAVYCFFIQKAPVAERITWGVNFSQMQSQNLGLDWKANYSALLDDMGVRNIKIITNWNFVEPKKAEYYFDDVDWQVSQAQARGAKMIYVVGMKTGRWPECHVPDWASGLSKQAQQDSILDYIKASILRYKDSPSIVAWQAENEPLFNFGKCPWYDKNFLIKEVALIKSLDATRPVIVSDSGEQSLWFGAAKIGDIVGSTMYRKLWIKIVDGLGVYGTFPIPPVVYYYKTQVIKYVFNKPVICVELQAEPWAPPPLSTVPLAEQEKTMNLEQFRTNIEYAKHTGFDEFYLWGAEWWYWLKTTQNKPEMWSEAEKLFKEGN